MKPFLNCSTRWLLATLVATCLLSSSASAQKESVKPGINDHFQDPDVQAWIARFEREGGDVFEHRRDVLRTCELEKRMHVADVGAGTGLFTEIFARKVGAEGKVYAVDIAKNFVEHIEKACREKQLENVVGVVCSTESTELPANSVDLVFICDTYHHFEFYDAMLASIFNALRPGGQLIVIDFERIPGVSREWTLGHVRAGKGRFTSEIERAGFRLLEELKIPGLKENYFLRFARP